MSIMCKMEKCKMKSGMCNCEKVMSAIVIIGAIAAIVHHFIA